MIRLGLIGAGRWGQNYVKTIAGLPDVSLDAVASRSRGDWHELIDKQRCDGVIIATPPAVHAEMLAAAIHAGMPALVEKPLTLNLPDALDLQKLLRENPTPVLVDHIFLFHPGYRELKRLSSGLGPIRSIHSIGGNHGPSRSDCTALWDYGPHDVAMCLDLLGPRVRQVECRHLEAPSDEGGLGGSYELTLTFPDNVRATIQVSNIHREKVRRLTVEFASETLVFDDLAIHKLVNAAGTALPIADGMPLTKVVETFVDGIRGDLTEAFGLDVAVGVVRVLHAAQSNLGS